MNKLEEWEVNTYINYIPFADRNTWEQCRNTMYITAQVNSTKKLKPTDIFELPWERKELKPKHIKSEIPTSNDIAQCRKEALLMAKQIEEGNVKKGDSVLIVNMNEQIKLL